MDQTCTRYRAGSPTPRPVGRSRGAPAFVDHPTARAATRGTAAMFFRASGLARARAVNRESASINFVFYRYLSGPGDMVLLGTLGQCRGPFKNQGPAGWN